MTRLSGDELRDGFVWNGFDDALQVWVVDGVVPRCGHPPAMARQSLCCPAFRLAGRRIDTIAGAQCRCRRPTPGDHTGPPTEA